MAEKNFCFHARVGSDRYRLALLALFPQLLQLREIVKRLAVIYATKKSAELSDVNATVVSNSDGGKENEKIAALRKVESNFETAWTITLEAAGVLSNSFAPFPSENCNDQFSKQYANLWSRCDLLFFESLESLKQCFSQCFQSLKNLDGVKGDAHCLDQQPTELRQLYKETKQIESKDTRLKQSLLSSITIESQDQPSIELIFPMSTSRLFM